MSNINENDNLSLSSLSDKKTYDVTYSFLCQGTSSIEVTDSKLFDKNDPSYLGDDKLQDHLSNLNGQGKKLFLCIVAGLALPLQSSDLSIHKAL